MTTLYIRDGLLVRVGDNLATSEECCCFDVGICHYPTEWRVVDGTDHVYADGPVEITPDGANLLLQHRPELLPEAYPAAGPTDYRLQVQDHHADPAGSSGWVTIAEWSHDLDVCTSRYVQWPEGPWGQPEHWTCKVDPVTLLPIEPCDPCDQPMNWGDDAYAPENGVGVMFTGGADGEWTNLANWEDASGNSPAGSLPAPGDDVTIEGSVTSTWGAIEVADMTIAAGGGFHVAASVTNLYCGGTVGRDGECEGVIGNITVSGLCEFDGGTLEGEVTANGSAATFVGNSAVGDGGVLNGDAVFSTAGVLDGGTVTGNATFSVIGDNRGAIGGNATFNDSTKNEINGVVDGTAVFNGDAENASGATVASNAEFNGNAKNLGSVGADGEFNDASENAGTGTIGGTGQFFDTAKNIGTVNGNALFGGYAINTSDGGFGQVLGDATFTGNSRFESGEVTGTATFTDDACYVAGTAGTFDPDPPPEC